MDIEPGQGPPSKDNNYHWWSSLQLRTKRLEECPIVGSDYQLWILLNEYNEISSNKLFNPKYSPDLLPNYNYLFLNLS